MAVSSESIITVSYTHLEVEVKMHKAIAIIQFKLEGQLMMRRPEFHMADRLLPVSYTHLSNTDLT